MYNSPKIPEGGNIVGRPREKEIGHSAVAEITKRNEVKKKTKGFFVGLVGAAILAAAGAAGGESPEDLAKMNQPVPTIKELQEQGTIRHQTREQQEKEEMKEWIDGVQDKSSGDKSFADLIHDVEEAHPEENTTTNPIYAKPYEDPDFEPGEIGEK